MNKSKSYPIIYENESFKINKSQSSDNLKDKLNDFYFEDFFEGDGPLGINFINHDDKCIVSEIIKGTVSDETYGLEKNMILIEINDENTESMGYKKNMKKIQKEWREKAVIFLKFKKNIIKDIYYLLNEIDYSDYYYYFIELGVRDRSDFQYIEITDLIKMGIPYEKIDDFNEYNKKININIYEFCMENNIITDYEKILKMNIQDVSDFETIQYPEIMHLSEDGQYTLMMKYKNLRKKNIILTIKKDASGEDIIKLLTKYKGMNIAIDII